MSPDDVLRKGSGTLCESLLMVQATKGTIVFPTKQTQSEDKLHKGGLLESETYVGGHVEQCASGVFRSDIPMKFSLDTAKIDEIIAEVDAIMAFAIEAEAKAAVSEISNYSEVKAKISAQLQ